MLNELTTDGEALRLFFTDDVYLVAEPEYKTVTVAIQTPAPPPPKAYKFLGANKRNILILVNDPENEVSDEKGKELLRKIVKSVNLTAADFALLNYAGYSGTTFQELKSHFSSVLVFAFGVPPKHLGMEECPENAVVTVNEVRFIFSAELRKLEEDQSSKKVLWGCLKQLGL